jgi:hypothetical protein
MLQRLHRATAPALQCRCCRQPSSLIPRDDLGQPGEFAVCFASGRIHRRDADGNFILAPSDALTRVWNDTGDLPVVVPGVRIDLSKEGYA